MYILIFYALLFITIFILNQRNKAKEKKVAVAAVRTETEEESEDRQWLREYLFEYKKYKYIRPYSERENNLWEDRMKGEMLRHFQQFIIKELENIPITDWEYLILHAIYTKSPALNYYLIDGRLDLRYMRQQEFRGHLDALQGVKSVPVSRVSSLREYFHLMHERILNSVASDDIFYLRGQWKIAHALKVFVASQGTFIPSIQSLYSRDALAQQKQDEEYFQRDVVGRLAYYFNWLQDKKQEFYFPIEGSDPSLEFNLSEIAKADNFEYEGSLLTNLYLDLLERLGKLTDDHEPIHQSRINELSSAHFVTFTYGQGTVRLIMHMGAVDYYPNRLFIIFFDIPADDPLVNHLRTYNLHLCANG